MRIPLVLVLTLGLSLTSALPYTAKQTSASVTFSAVHGTRVNASALGSCGQVAGPCPSGQCCSKYGYCGYNSSYCDAGCQPSYGTCSTNSSANSTSYSFSYLPVCSHRRGNNTAMTKSLTSESLVSVSSSMSVDGVEATAFTNASPSFSFDPLSSSGTPTNAFTFAPLSTTNTTTAINFAPLSSEATTATTAPFTFAPLSTINSTVTILRTITRTVSPIPFASSDSTDATSFTTLSDTTATSSASKATRPSSTSNVTAAAVACKSKDPSSSVNLIFAPISTSTN